MGMGMGMACFRLSATCAPCTDMCLFGLGEVVASGIVERRGWERTGNVCQVVACTNFKANLC